MRDTLKRFVKRGKLRLGNWLGFYDPYKVDHLMRVTKRLASNVDHAVSQGFYLRNDGVYAGPRQTVREALWVLEQLEEDYEKMRFPLPQHEVRKGKQRDNASVPLPTNTGLQARNAPQASAN